MRVEPPLDIETAPYVVDLSLTIWERKGKRRVRLSSIRFQKPVPDKAAAEQVAKPGSDALVVMINAGSQAAVLGRRNARKGER